MKRISFWLIGLSFSFLAAWLMAEILFRLFAPQLVGPTQGVFDPQLGILPKPNTVTWRKTPYYTFSATHDAAGRRIVSRTPASVSARVLFLGDSFTYGVGVADDETFASRVQEILLSSAANAQVINAGNSGIGTDFELRYFQVRGAAEKPAAVELFFFGNDFLDNQAGVFFDVLPGDVLRPKLIRENPVRRLVTMMPLHDFVMSHSQVAALLRGLTARQDATRVPLEFLVKHPSLARLLRMHLDTQHELDAPSERLTAIYLSRLAEVARDTGARFGVFYIPSVDDVRAFRDGGKQSVEESALRRICSDQGLKLTSLTPAVATAPYAPDELFYGEGHWKARTHSLVASIIAAGVRADLGGAENRR